MSELFKNIQKADLSEVTKRNYLQKSIVLIKLVGKPIEYIIEHPDAVIKKIESEYDNTSSRKSFFVVILAIFRYNPELKTKYKKEYEKWMKGFEEIDEKVNDRYKENAPSDRQKEGYIKYDDIVKKRESLESGNIERLLLSMYTYIKPLRCDFNRIRLYKSGDKKTEPNYIYDGRLVLRKYKTAKSHEEYDEELPKELQKEIKESLKKEPREWLFQMNSGEPYLRNTYTKWTTNTFKRLFGKPLTVSLIRHSFINTLDFNTLTIKEKEEIAESMKHSVSTQDRYRLIFKD
jgi:hypothetical protein